MLRILLKKQMLELNQQFFQNKKKGTSRSKTSSYAFLLLYVVLLIFLGAIFFSVGMSLCEPLVQAGIGWLYFVIMGMIAVALGVFGSVFNTFASLYQAKDNDLLLSLPIPIPSILVVRLSGVYIMGLLFGSIVMIPTIIVYAVVTQPGVGTIVCDIIWLLLISIFVLTLSCILGWVVAKINSKLKNKSMITVIVSLLFIGAYYYIYFKANDLLKAVIVNSMTVGAKIKGAAYPLYWLGRAGEGELVSVLLLALVVFVFFALVYGVLAHSFLKIVTANRGNAKVHYREKRMKRKSQNSALLARERQHFLSSATYMLNCSLGTLILIVAAVMLLFKGDFVYQFLTQIFAEDIGFIAVIGCVAVCILASMNDITAPSVSLEGKNLWIVQSLPVTSWQVLKAKLNLHLLFTVLPTFLCSVGVIIVLHTSFVLSVLLLLLTLLFTVLNAEVGLALNLMMPNLKWTNEAVVVKQSFGVFLAILLGWGYAFALIGIYLLVDERLGAPVYLTLFSLLTLVFVLLLYNWLKKRGTKIFENLGCS